MSKKVIPQGNRIFVGDIVFYTGDYEPFVRQFRGCNLEVKRVISDHAVEVYLPGGSIALPAAHLTLIPRPKKVTAPLLKDVLDATEPPPIPIENPSTIKDLKDEILLLKKEILYLKHYGNKDCVAMAEKAMAADKE